MPRHLMTSAFFFCPIAAMADAPTVVTDIAPIHSLVAQVMGDLGTPALLMPPGTDPHHYNLRPSDAQAIADARLLVTVGRGLSPLLEDAFAELGGDALQLHLAETDGWETLEFRGSHDHGHGHGGEDQAGHEDKHADDHGDEHDAAHADDHSDAHDHGGDHDGADEEASDIDPHAWMDPSIAIVWTAEIAEALSAADPQNADAYRANQIAYAATLQASIVNLEAQLAPLREKPLLWPHDGYQYFENAFSLTSAGSIAETDAAAPGPNHISELRGDVRSGDVICVFSDASVNDQTAALVTEGSDIQALPVDGIGFGLDAGPELYLAMIERLATQIASCDARN